MTTKIRPRLPEITPAELDAVTLDQTIDCLICLLDTKEKWLRAKARGDRRGRFKVERQRLRLAKAIALLADKETEVAPIEEPQPTIRLMVAGNEVPITAQAQ